MEEAACISYNNAVEELRAREYPMLKGEYLLGEGMEYQLILSKAQPTSIMLGLLSTPSR